MAHEEGIQNDGGGGTIVTKNKNHEQFRHANEG